MLERSAHAVLGCDPVCLFVFLLQPETDHVKMEPLSRGSLGGGGERRTWVWEGVCGGQGEEGGGPLMTETAPFLWNLLPFWATVFRSVWKQGLGSSVFMKGGTR